MIHILNCNVLELLLFYLKITYLLFCKPNTSTMCLQSTKKRKDTLGLAFVNISSCE